MPLVSMNNGYGENASAYMASTDAGAWDNVWFAEQGDAVLTYTPRGFWGSCGPTDSGNGQPSGLPPACTQNGRHYWMTFDDLRYTTRDLQWLIGRFVDAGFVSPNSIAVTGASMGGGITWEMAELNDRTVCGGYGWNTANGTDPCAGKSSGLVPWKSPDGTPLHIAVAVPQFTYFSLGSVLMPNGTASDGTPDSPSSNPYLLDEDPVGVPLQAVDQGLSQEGSTSSFFASPGTDSTADWSNWFSDLLSPINSSTTASGTILGAAMFNAEAQWDWGKSPGSPYVNFDADVPILTVQGLDDSLMTPVQAQLMYQKAKAFDPAYPISVIWGDAGHWPASNPVDLIAGYTAQANAVLSYYLNGLGTAPTSSESAYLVDCGPNAQNGLTQIAAPNLTSLETNSVTLSSSVSETTTSTAAGSEASALNPMDWGTCPNTPIEQDSGVASWTFPVGSSAEVVLGAPTITVEVHSTASDAELNARLFVESSGTQTLMSTGTYRLAVSPGTTDVPVSFQIPMTAWDLSPGQVLKLEITGDDAPAYQADAIASTTTIDSVSLRIPTTDLAAFGSAYNISAVTGSVYSGWTAALGCMPNAAVNYQATVNWGDGSTSNGVVSYVGYGWCVVTASHTWSAAGTYPVTTSLIATSGVAIVQHAWATIKGGVAS